MRSFLREMRDPINLIFAGLVLCAALALLANSVTLWRFTADDSYITFRYSANLVSGIGPTFNAVPPRAEGYTSFLWMIIMAVPHLFGFGVVSFAKVFGILTTVGSFGWMAFLMLHLANPGIRPYRLAAAGIVILFFAILPETAVHAVSGMETAGYVFLLMMMVSLAYLALNGRRWAMLLLPVTALLCGLMRPEANLLAALILAFVFFKTSDRKSLLVATTLCYILPGALYFAWRVWYFRVLLPLPFYAKTGAGGLPGLNSVLDFCLFILASVGLYFGLGLFVDRKLVQLILIAVLPDLFFFMFSAPVMNYDYRFTFPLLPLFLTVAGLGVAVLLEQSHRWACQMPERSRLGARPWLAPVWVGALVLGVLVGQTLPRAGGLVEHKLAYADGLLRNHVRIGNVLKDIPHNETTPVLVVTDAGIMPYISGWMTIDGGGLNDVNISLRRVPYQAYFPQYNPDVIVLTSTNLEVYQNDGAEQRELYRLALEWGLDVIVRSPFYQGDSIWVLAKPGSPAALKLAEKFK